MTGAPLIERACGIAARLHAGQVDKLGEPYLGHCERVAAKLHDDEARVVAYCTTFSKTPRCPKRSSAACSATG